MILGSQVLYDLAVDWTAPELESNPASHIAHWIRHGASALNHGPTTFVVIYLLAHGIIKLAIAISLLRERSTWIFPVAIAVLGAFVAFMGYRLAIHWSWWLLALALFDAITIALVANEWRNYQTAMVAAGATG